MFKAHRLSYHSTLGSKVTKKKTESTDHLLVWRQHPQPLVAEQENLHPKLALVLQRYLVYKKPPSRRTLHQDHA